jgi:nucleotide-binding universal stress UspA family protein
MPGKTRTRFRMILVPYDFSPDAAAALRVAGAMAEAERGEVRVLHVMTPAYPPHGGPLRPPAHAVDATARILHSVATRALRRRNVRVWTRVAVGQPVAAIVAAARTVDCVVMGTRGRSGFARLVLGSVAERVVRTSPVPVLTVPQPRRRRRRTA